MALTIDTLQLQRVEARLRALQADIAQETDDESALDAAVGELVEAEQYVALSRRYRSFDGSQEFGRNVEEQREQMVQEVAERLARAQSRPDRLSLVGEHLAAVSVELDARAEMLSAADRVALARRRADGLVV